MVVWSKKLMDDKAQQLYISRFILVKYSDRGLVANGQTNLKLFNKLYWIFLVTAIAYSYGVFPFAQQVRGGFPGNSPKGQICLKMNFQLGETNLKQRIAQLIGQAVLGILRFRFMKIITRYVKGQNLNRRTFAQFGGKHQRNVFNIKQTNSYLFVCFCLLLLDNTLITFYQLLRLKIDENTRFVIHNLLWIISMNIFFGIFIPVKHILLSRQCLPSLYLV